MADEFVDKGLLHHALTSLCQLVAAAAPVMA